MRGAASRPRRRSCSPISRRSGGPPPWPRPSSTSSGARRPGGRSRPPPRGSAAPSRWSGSRRARARGASRSGGSSTPGSLEARRSVGDKTRDMATGGDAIGIFDSGVGGLTVLHALLEALPHEDLVYLGDTGRYPYGTKSAETVTRYSIENVDFLIAKGIKLHGGGGVARDHQELDALRERRLPDREGHQAPGGRVQHRLLRGPGGARRALPRAGRRRDRAGRAR